MTRSTIQACVFDAYGTLFDVHSVSTLAEKLAPGHGAAISRLWRTKQLEYSWLASLMTSPGYARPDFRAVTAMALDYAIAALVLPLDDKARARLKREYGRLLPFADAHGALAALAPRPRVILSNGTLRMLKPLVERSGLGEVLDGVISVDDVGVYKPSPKVYALAVARLGVPAASIAFVSANAWDAAAAQAFGMTSIWINRGGVPAERHVAAPEFAVGSLTEVAAILNSWNPVPAAKKCAVAAGGRTPIKRAPRRARPGGGRSRRPA